MALAEFTGGPVMAALLPFRAGSAELAGEAVE